MGARRKVAPQALARGDGAQRLPRSAHGMVAFHRSKLERLCLLSRYAGNGTIAKERTKWQVMIDTLLRDLRQPEYVHVLLNPLPIYGLVIAWLGSIIALILKSRRAQIIALLLVLISSFSAWPVYEFG